MNSQVLFALIRHILTIAGGALAAKYGVSGETIDAAAGAATTLAGVAWSIYEKRRKPV
jgi:hypothetical protein